MASSTRRQLQRDQPVHAARSAQFEELEPCPQRKRCSFASAFPPRRLKLIARQPLDRLLLLAGQPAQDKSKTRQLRVASKVPVRVVLVRRLVIVIRCVILELCMTPRQV